MPSLQAVSTRKSGVAAYWFCCGMAAVLALFGLWNALIGKEGRSVPILLFCLLMAGVFYLAGFWARWIARRAAGQL